MITERFKKTVLKILKISDFDMDEDTQANQIPAWDSLNHANVIAALEDEYDIRLKNIEILNCHNMGDLHRLIDAKLERKKSK